MFGESAGPEGDREAHSLIDEVPEEEAPQIWHGYV
jgi:hypothetical protein